MTRRLFAGIALLGLFFGNVLIGSATCLAAPDAAAESRRLYVAAPGIRNYLRYGGHGLLVYDIDAGHKLLKRLPIQGLNEKGEPLNIKGICANAASHRLYMSTPRQLMCFDLLSEKIVWQREYEAGCDRMAIHPDGKTIFLPSFEGPLWHVVDAATGDVLEKIVTNSGSHNTICGLDGRHVYLAGLKSPLLRVAGVRERKVLKEIGPFGGSVRPFTVNGRQTLCFVNVNDLLGFEVGDLATGKVLHRVEVSGFKTGPTKRHGCPSHGIGLTPDERELWVCDSANKRLHVFDAILLPPKQILSIEVRDEPGWIGFGIDGRLAYPSTGEVIDARTHKIVATLQDEQGRDVQSEKLIEIDFQDDRPVRVADQFGLGRKTDTKPAGN